MVPLWPLVAPQALLMSLSFILLPPAGQMFICNAAGKEKASYSDSRAGREDTAEKDSYHSPYQIFPNDSGLHGAVVTAFDGQGHSSCGLH